MSTHKQIDKICCAVMALTLLLTIVFMKGESPGIMPVMAQAGYALGLFDDSRVHSIDIVMEDWEEFLSTCENEEYSACSVVIDNEAYKNVGIRAKGNTSLSQVSAYGNDRYSFKIEFDCYEKGKSYYGLDKISLNNLIQDNTYMKDYLTYQMMGEFGVAAPLCSYVYVTVNGEDWGLYLAVEGVEESFLSRNYGNDYGNLYKPDSADMGGGRGNGGGFDMDRMMNFDSGDSEGAPGNFGGEFPAEFPEGFQPENLADSPWRSNLTTGSEENRAERSEEETENLSKKLEKGQEPEKRQLPERSGGDWSGRSEEMQGKGKAPGGGGMSMGSDDILLKYSGDEYENYENIFDSAKTDISNADRDRLIASLKKLGEGEDIENVVDVEAVMRYFVAHNFVCNFDSYTGRIIHNYYLYEKDGKLSMIPWDYNLAFGGFDSQTGAEGMVNFPVDTPVSDGSVADRPMLAWIFENEEYTEMYHQYFEEFITDIFESGYFEDKITTVKEMIAPFVEKDPTKFCTCEEFEKGVDALKTFCLLRAESVSGQLAGDIPSTSEGQKNDSSNLVDASSINLSDMGAMNMGKMGGKSPR